MPFMPTGTTEPAATQLTEKQLRQLQEVQVKINLKSFFRAWNWLTKKMPFDVYQTVTRKIEGKSKKLMFGNGSLFGLPIGIILRNTSRAANNLSSGRYGAIAKTIGVVAAIGAVAGGAIIGIPGLAGAIGLGVVGGFASHAAGAVGALLLSKPIYTAATLAASTVGAAGAAIFSTLISAPANLIVGIRRSRASLKGIKLTEEQLAAQKEVFDRRSPSARYAREQEENVRAGLTRISKAKKEQIYLDLKAEFEPAAAVPAASVGQPAAKAAPKGPTA